MTRSGGPEKRRTGMSRAKTAVTVVYPWPHFACPPGAAEAVPREAVDREAEALALDGRPPPSRAARAVARACLSHASVV